MLSEVERQGLSTLSTTAKPRDKGPFSPSVLPSHPKVPPLRPQQSPQDVHEILGCPNARLRMAFAKADSVVNDSRNFIADAPFGRE